MAKRKIVEPNDGTGGVILIFVGVALAGAMLMAASGASGKMQACTDACAPLQGDPWGGCKCVSKPKAS